MENASYYSLEKIWLSHLLSKKLKVNTYKTIIPYYRLYSMVVKLDLSPWKRSTRAERPPARVTISPLQPVKPEMMPPAVLGSGWLAGTTKTTRTKTWHKPDSDCGPSHTIFTFLHATRLFKEHWLQKMRNGNHYTTLRRTTAYSLHRIRNSWWTKGLDGAGKSLVIRGGGLRIQILSTVADRTGQFASWREDKSANYPPHSMTAHWLQLVSWWTKGLDGPGKP